ncbi:MAG: hypothetical protein LBF28_03610 [Rickettsiales bacterium]|jgi:hypothetical protein|nr:hypothetical protein [Rickettsiales bacterium]
MKPKYLFVALCCLAFGATAVAHAADEKFLSCGPGYVLAAKSKTDGINVAECQKLWCRDLETGKNMGVKNSAERGYKSAASPTELCDVNNKCVECFGDRKWCAGEPTGSWNPEYGAYTRGGGDTATYVSYQKGDCFSWRLEKPNCEAGQQAILKNGEWICVTSGSGSSTGTRESAVRRTGTIRRVIR